MEYIIILILVLILLFSLVVLGQSNKEKFKSTITDYNIPYTFYYINLEKAAARRDKINKLFEKYQIKNKIIDAVLGGPNQRDKELACLRSHIKAIQTFYDSGDEVGIICEDDLSFEYKNYWRNSLETVIQKAPSHWEVIQLAYIACYFPNLIVSCSNSHYVPYHPWVCSTLCYAINRKGAEKILNSKQPPPSIIEHYIYTQTKTYIYKYPMFTYPNDNDSFIHSDHLSFHDTSKLRITNFLKYNN